MDVCCRCLFSTSKDETRQGGKEGKRSKEDGVFVCEDSILEPPTFIVQENFIVETDSFYR